MSHAKLKSLRNILFCALLAPMIAIAEAPDRVIVFGDSLSDAGNYYLETGQWAEAPFEPIPDAPYEFRDGFRFSNGRTWVEQWAGNLGIGSSAKPALESPGHFTNYAFGRARAREGAVPFPLFDLGYQRQQFVNDFGSAPPDALYVIWIGTNDVRDAVGALQLDPSGALTQQILTAALGAIQTHIMELAGMGAQRFLVLNVPDLSITPAVSGLPAPIPAVAQGISLQFNGNLASMMAGLSGFLGVEILELDTFTLLNTVVAAPQAFGLENVTAPCLTFFAAEDYLCDRPNDYLFLDAAHPTIRGHRIVARAVQDLLEDG